MSDPSKSAEPTLVVSLTQAKKTIAAAPKAAKANASVAKPKPRRTSPAPKKSAKPKKPARKAPQGPSSRQKEMLALTRQLSNLQSEWKKAREHYTLRVEGQFAEARTVLEKATASRTDGPTHAQRAKIAEILKQVNVKPKKGRAKDLRRVEEALDSLFGRLDSK